MLKVFNLFKDSRLFYSVLVKVIQMLGGVIIIKLLSTSLSKYEFGYYAWLIAILGLMGAFPFSAMNQGVLRFSVDYKDKVYYFSNMLAIYFIFLFIYSLSIFLFSIFYNFYVEWVVFLKLIPFLLISSVLFNFLAWFYNSVQNQKYFAYVLFFDLFVKVFGIMFLVYIEEINTEKVMILFGFSSSLIFILFSRSLFKIRMVSFPHMLKVFFSQLTYIYPILIWSIFVWAQGMVYRWYLGTYSSLDDVATFAIMSSLAILPVTAITGILGTYLLPKLFHELSHEKENISWIIKKTSFYVLLLLLIMWLLIYIYSAEVVSFVTDDKYANDSWMLPYMFFSMIIYAIGNIFSYKIYLAKKTKKLMLANILPGFLALTLGYVLIKNYAMNGAIITFILTYSLTGILSFFSAIGKE